ncbi:MAG: sulfotransferase domain-containing protein [Actinomycetota bacterium]
MLPNFLIIGAMKGGTTSLYRYLSDHPQIFMPSVKEPLFFSSNWDRGIEWYERLFDGAGQVTAIGEASTEYTAFPHIPDVPMRVAKLLPEVRLVYIIRHPIDRMLSEYHYNLVRGLERDPSADRSLLEDSTYYNVSCYALQIEQYLEHFPRDQLLVLKSEDLKRDRVRTLGRVYEILGVDKDWQPSDLWEEFQTSSKKRSRRPVDQALRRVPGYRRLASVAPLSLKQVKYRLTTRKAPPKPRLSDGARREIEDRLRDDVRRLRRYMGDDLSAWGLA